MVVSEAEFDEKYGRACKAVHFIRDCRFARAISGGAIWLRKEDLEELLGWAEDIASALPEVLEALRHDESGALRESLMMK